MVAAIASLFADRLVKHEETASKAVLDPRTEGLISRVRSLNPTASREFLVTFRPQALELYLEHLSCALEQPRKESRWVRPADTPAIVVRVLRD